jgi:hypothetical protein
MTSQTRASTFYEIFEVTVILLEMLRPKKESLGPYYFALA